MNRTEDLFYTDINTLSGSVLLEVTDERATKERLLLYFSPLKRESLKKFLTIFGE